MFKRMAVCLYAWHCKNEIGSVQACKHIVGAQEVLVWLFRGHWKKGVDFSKRDFASFGECVTVSREVVEGTGC